MAPPPPPNIVHADTESPVFARLFPSRRVLFPVHHQLVPVRIVARAIDLIDPHPTAHIVAVSSNEPAHHDWEITGPLSVKLRAEHSGHHTDRVYTITVEAQDASGNTTTGTVEVAVPHDHHDHH